MAMFRLFDTHNHFDDSAFDSDRLLLLQQAVNHGVKQMVMTGITAKTFEKMLSIQKELNQWACNADESALFPMINDCTKSPLTQPQQILSLSSAELVEQKRIHVALGLHPFFIKEHSTDDLQLLDNLLTNNQVIAIGEVGLDTFTAEMKQEENIAKQFEFFTAQLDLAVKHHLPVLLHIRKSHGDSLKILKQHSYDAKELGGIAHSFSGGQQEAIAFVKLGFKLGITGQVCNPNAKKLHKAIKSAVAEFGVSCLVIETDCPDCLPVGCCLPSELSSCSDRQNNRRNTPANLRYVLNALSQLLDIDKEELAEQLWQNSINALKLSLASL